MYLSDCRMRAPGGNSGALLQVAAHLYQLQGRYEMALAIYLEQGEAAVFDFIAEHGLLRLLGDYVPQLMAIDEVRATQLLVEQQYEVPPQVVVAKLQVRARATQRARGCRLSEQQHEWPGYKMAASGAGMEGLGGAKSLLLHRLLCMSPLLNSTRAHGHRQELCLVQNCCCVYCGHEPPLPRATCATSSLGKPADVALCPSRHQRSCCVTACRSSRRGLCSGATTLRRGSGESGCITTWTGCSGQIRLPRPTLQSCR